MLTNAEYHKLLDGFMEALMSQIEAADANAVLDAELAYGAITIVCPQNKTLVISRQTPVQELWYASPRLGGLHFSYDGSAWKLKDGREFQAVLKDDLAVLAGITL